MVTLPQQLATFLWTCQLMSCKLPQLACFQWLYSHNLHVSSECITVNGCTQFAYFQWSAAWSRRCPPSTGCIGRVPRRRWHVNVAVPAVSHGRSRVGAAHGMEMWVTAPSPTWPAYSVRWPPTHSRMVRRANFWLRRIIMLWIYWWCFWRCESHML